MVHKFILNMNGIILCVFHNTFLSISITFNLSPNETDSEAKNGSILKQYLTIKTIIGYTDPTMPINDN